MLNANETKLWKEKSYAQRLAFITGVFSGIKQRWDVTPCEHMAYPIIRTLINHVWPMNTPVQRIDQFILDELNGMFYTYTDEILFLEEKMREIDEIYGLALKLKEILDNPPKV